VINTFEIMDAVEVEQRRRDSYIKPQRRDRMFVLYFPSSRGGSPTTSHNLEDHLRLTSLSSKGVFVENSTTPMT
jgi:hypothetical protein